jgi:hypothetical protein
MKTAITLFAIVGMTALQAYAAPAVEPTLLSNVPMNVAKRLNASPTDNTASVTIEKTGVPMRVAARSNQAVPAPQAIADGNTDVRLSGVRACHAKRT